MRLFIRMIYLIILFCGWQQLTSCGSDPVIPAVPVEREAAIRGPRIAWDYQTLARVSDEQTSGYNGYARMTTLPSGDLICVYESNGSIVAVKSVDKGHSWSQPGIVAPKEDGINMAVPDVLVLQDETLLVMYNPRPYEIDPSRRFAIRTIRSRDEGSTWQDERVLYEAGYRFENGCWEPSAVQLADGEIRLYFANEGIYTSSNEQNISMLISQDGGLSWTEDPQIVSFRPGFRDGMPVPLVQESEVDIAIEDNGDGNFKPSIIVQEDPESDVVGAESENRLQPLKDPLETGVYAGAPYLITFPDGTVLLSYQGSEGRGTSLSQAVMRVVMGSVEMNGFDRKTTPFILPASRNGLWNSMAIIDEHTVAALTSTNTWSSIGATEVWMIKGYVMEEPELPGIQMTPDGQAEETVWQNDLPSFVGHEGNTRLMSGIGKGEGRLYLYSRVDDADVRNDPAASTQSDGVFYFLDFNTDTGAAPDEKTWKIFVSAGGQVTAYQGSHGSWVERSLELQKGVSDTDTGYIQEISISLSALETETFPTGFAVSLKAIGAGGNYIEMLTGSEETRPYTWPRIR